MCKVRRKRLLAQVGHEVGRGDARATSLLIVDHNVVGRVLMHRYGWIAEDDVCWGVAVHG